MEYIYGEPPQSPPPRPDAVLADYDHDYYKICWKSNEAGVVVIPPGLIRKDDLAKLYPDVVDVWNPVKKEAAKIEKNFFQFCCEFYGRLPDGTKYMAKKKNDRGVDCNQSLRPGMRQHWGEVKKCATHPQTQHSTHVCKGCRVSHYEQVSATFDRGVLMAQGARVLVCRECIRKAKRKRGNHNCICDTLWMCFRCREAELKELAGARKEYVEGFCGKCRQTGNLVDKHEICLHCDGWRSYAGDHEDLCDTEEQEVEDGDEVVEDGEKQGG
ncbi:hypothetical protein HBI24_205980 [Parastagonospora nodorum]|nr:hypothetical protein HBH53_109730 [Parastagonospora nodorum]KAH3970884.1 hypothetical protein HBH52_161850 [Parastagonospora nodorum]KAH3997899.1 hypothetical protein HBI10_136550 [Parastagonospora nodorum]KAH4020520.1 hypothetical protein HBI13_115920 [Parastagonospora nodorum]KAH4047954.1 hypothetical protein HBH49_162550 [Parastagonospora nodorum]